MSKLVQISFGTYPEVSLSDAREKRLAARKQVAADIDPSHVRRAQQQSAVQELDSFEVVAREWHQQFTPTWTEVHAHTTLRRLERDVFPWLGSLPIAEIKALDVLKVLRRVETRGALETAHRIKTICDQVNDGESPVLVFEQRGHERDIVHDDYYQLLTEEVK